MAQISLHKPAAAAVRRTRVEVMAERQPPAKEKLPLLPLPTTAYTAKTSKKKMSMEEKNSRKKELDRARDKTRVNIGSAFQRWRELRDLKGFKTDFELGTFLLDSYECRSKKDPAGHKGTSEPLTPQVPNVKESPDHYSLFREEADDAFKSRMCSVVRCDSWRRGVQCFSLPADSDKRLEWVQFLFLVNGQRIKESSWVDIRVCAEHFTPSCFLQVNPATSIALLNTDAVPSVYKETTEPIDPAFKPDQIKTSAGPTPGSSALDKEEISALSAPGSPALSTVSESSESSYCRMLQKIENLDIIREKINLLQRMKMYVVNEKQLLQLFSAKCPLCQSKVKMEKSFHGVLLVVNQQCLQCSYSRQWKNLSEKSTSALLDDHQAECLEISVEISADEMSSEKDQIADEEGDHREERDEPSKTDKVENSDDNWEPEHESLILDSDEDEDYNPSDEDTEESASKHKELCTECGKLFKTRRPHICEYKIKPFSCNICGKRCVSEQSLAIHSKIHNPNHQFLCKFCLAGFKTKTDKKNHEQIHSGEETPYKCPHCSEMFDTFKNRQVHMKDHPEQGLLKCHICGMGFLYFKVYQRHLLVHTGEKPFKCSVCERGFNQSGHLKSHMRMHTGERPYKCQHCNRGFNHNVSLKSHLKRFHTESENQKTANLEGSVGGDPEGERGTDSLNDIVEEDHTAEEEVWTGGGGFKKRRTTGRPIGRPKKKIKDTTVEEEKRQRQHKNTKGRNRKPKRRQSSSEDDEEELCESDESLDLTEDEEKNNEKVTSRQKENEDLDFDPTEMKKTERNKNCKTPKRPRGRPRKKAVC